MTLTVLRRTSQVYGSILPYWNLSDIFHDKTGVMGLGNNYLGNKVSFSSHHFKSTWYQQDFRLMILTLIIWSRECLSEFSTVQLPSFPCFLHHSLWKKVTLYSPHLRSRKLCFPFWRAEYTPYLLSHFMSS